MDGPQFFNHSPTEGHLDYFQFEAIADKADMNSCIQVFV